MDKQLNQAAATIDNGIHKSCYLVVHPLNDYPEQKLKTDWPAAVRDGTNGMVVALPTASLRS
jgi:hypothetical protein